MRQRDQLGLAEEVVWFVLLLASLVWLSAAIKEAGNESGMGNRSTEATQ